LRNALPAPFEEGSNVAILTNLPVEYRLPEGMELGYLELLNAPRDNARTILAVLGNATAGVQQAGGALTRSAFRSMIKGDFVIVNGETITSTDTRTRSGVESISPSATAMVTPIQPASLDMIVKRDWIPVAALGLIMLMAMILMVGLITSIKSKKHAK